jgi:hypothetical protein
LAEANRPSRHRLGPPPPRRRAGAAECSYGDPRNGAVSARRVRYGPRWSMPTARVNDYEEAGRSPCAGAMARSLPPRRRSSSHRRGQKYAVPLRSGPVSHPLPQSLSQFRSLPRLPHQRRGGS